MILAAIGDPQWAGVDGRKASFCVSEEVASLGGDFSGSVRGLSVGALLWGMGQAAGMALLTRRGEEGGMLAILRVSLLIVRQDGMGNLQHWWVAGIDGGQVQGRKDREREHCALTSLTCLPCHSGTRNPHASASASS